MGRKDFPRLFRKFNCKVGVELGVARGDFSKDCLKHNWDEFYSIDRWGGDRGHGDKEYFNALKMLSKKGAYVLKSSFEDSIQLFDDLYFDFIYIDGYAHTGQDNGKTLELWYSKLKKGGIFAGHDYHKEWQATINTVNNFSKEQGKQISLTKGDQYPSWFFIK